VRQELQDLCAVKMLDHFEVAKTERKKEQVDREIDR